MSTTPTYYPISEDAARRAKEANSFRAYVEGSATAEYRRMVDRAAEIAERQELTEDEIAALGVEFEKGWRKDTPYPAWELQNNNANMRRLRERIDTLKKEAERAKNAPDPVNGDGYVLVENAAIGRIQFKFEGKPDEQTRSLLKGYGFRWAPSEAAWQRMLNDNGRYAARRVIEEMQKGEE